MTKNDQLGRQNLCHRHQFIEINNLLNTFKSSGLLNKCGVRPMLAVPIEENVARKNDESFYDENLQKILACLQLSEEIADNRKMMQVRITAFINPDILVIFPIFLYKDIRIEFSRFFQKFPLIKQQSSNFTVLYLTKIQQVFKNCFPAKN